MLHIVLGLSNCRGRLVPTQYLVMELPAFRQTGLHNLLVEYRIVILPVQKGIGFPVDVRGNIAGNHGCLDEKGPAAAHGVEEVALSVPSTEQQKASGQGLVDRGNIGLDPISPLV